MDNHDDESKRDDAKPPRPPAWLSNRQAAERLGKSVKALQKFVQRGYLHPVPKNGVSHFAFHEVEALASPGRRASPWLASPPKKRRGSQSAPLGKRTEGQEAAHVFRLLDEGLTLREIVTRAHVPPHRVRVLFREWQRPLDQGPPPDPTALGDSADLDALAAAAERLFAARDD